MKFTKIESGKSNINRWSLGEECIKDELDDELQGILEELQAIKDTEENIEESLELLGRKINLIEKLIAEGSTMSEVYSLIK